MRGFTFAVPFVVVLLAHTPAASATFDVAFRNVTSGPCTAEQVVLSNTRTNESVAVVVNYGGRVEALHLAEPATGRLRDVLMSNAGDACAMLQPSGFRGAMLVPYANRIANHTYVWNGTQYVLPNNEPSRNNSIHGLLYNKRLAVHNASRSDTAAAVVLTYTLGSDPGYPFPVQVALTYRLNGTGFTVEVAATNTNPSWPAPFYNSWHAYLNTPVVAHSTLQLDDCSPWLHLEVTNHSSIYSNMIPTGETTPTDVFNGKHPIGGTPTTPTYFDDGFKAREQCSPGALYRHRLSDATAGVVLFATREYRFVQVYTGATTAFNHSSVAVEVMSAATNAYNREKNGLHDIAGGETFRSQFGVYLTAP